MSAPSTMRAVVVPTTVMPQSEVPQVVGLSSDIPSVPVLTADCVRGTKRSASTTAPSMEMGTGGKKPRTMSKQAAASSLETAMAHCATEESNESASSAANHSYEISSLKATASALEGAQKCNGSAIRFVLLREVIL